MPQRPDPRRGTWRALTPDQKQELLDEIRRRQHRQVQAELRQLRALRR